MFEALQQRKGSDAESNSGGEKKPKPKPKPPQLRGDGNKHLVQQASIVGHLQRRQLLPSAGEEVGNRIFVEWGAGKGGLSLAVQQLCANARFVLVERASVRNKADQKIKKDKDKYKEKDKE